MITTTGHIVSTGVRVVVADPPARPCWVCMNLNGRTCRYCQPGPLGYRCHLHRPRRETR